MAEPQAATPTVESDAGAQEGPSMGEHCTTDRPTPSGQASTGEIIKLNDVDVYVSKPSDYPHAPARLLLLLTGGTGLRSTNNQIQADRFASEGFVVAMPDLFDGDAAPGAATMSDPATEGASLLEQVKLRAAETVKSFVIDMWLARHTEEKVAPILLRVVDGCTARFADAAANGVYAAGYCFGARYVLLLAAERRLGPAAGLAAPADEEQGGAAKTGPLIRAGALAHATLVSPEDFHGLKSPVSLVCVENDPLFPDEVRKAGEDYMSKNNVEHEVQVYPGVPHGFAVIGEYEDEAIKTAQATAYEQMLKWLQEH